MVGFITFTGHVMRTMGKKNVSKVVIFVPLWLVTHLRFEHWRVLVYSLRHFIEHLVGFLLPTEPCCTHVNKYLHMPKQPHECYQENLSSARRKCCQDMPNLHYIKPSWAHKKPYQTFEGSSEDPHMNISRTLSGLGTTLVPMYIHH